MIAHPASRAGTARLAADMAHDLAELVRSAVDEPLADAQESIAARLDRIAGEAAP